MSILSEKNFQLNFLTSPLFATGVGEQSLTCPTLPCDWFAAKTLHLLSLVRDYSCSSIKKEKVCLRSCLGQRLLLFVNNKKEEVCMRSCCAGGLPSEHNHLLCDRLVGSALAVRTICNFNSKDNLLCCGISTAIRLSNIC